MIRKLLLCSSFLLSFAVARAQVSQEYSESVKKAMAFYEAKQYQQSADAFTHAFAVNDGKGYPDDRYNAACSWALAGNKDSAFFQLERIATRSSYKDYSHMSADADLTSLHTDSRWATICDLVKKNKEKAEEGLNKPLVAILDTVFRDDQDGRMKELELEKKYGYNSKEVKDIWREINEKDSIDLIKIEAILARYGWLAPDVVGDEGNTTLFLVIQHSDLKVQEKYLPMMREAVKNKKANPGSLALLEDRIALREGRKQIYGSQVHGSPDGKYWVSPLEDPDNVDKRRAKVGLEPLADYVAQWNIKWDVAAYKKELQEIEKKEKGQ